MTNKKVEEKFQEWQKELLSREFNDSSAVWIHDPFGEHFEIHPDSAKVKSKGKT
jgi:phage terminase large subunit